MKIKFVVVLILTTLILQAQKNTDLIPVTKNGKYGFINSKGDSVISLIYDHAENFSDSRALVIKNTSDGSKHFYYLDVNGKIVINCDSIKTPLMIQGKDTTFDYWAVMEANSFKNGIAMLSCFGKQKPDIWHHYRYIRKDGKPIKAPEFYFAVSFENGYGKGFRDGQYYRVDTLGEMTPINVDTCNCFDGFVEFSVYSYDYYWGKNQFPEFDRGKSDFNRFVASNQFFSEKNTSVYLTLWLEIDRLGRVVDWSLMDIFNHKYSKLHDLSSDIEQFVKNMPPFKPAKIQGVPFCSKISIELKISDTVLSASFR